MNRVNLPAVSIVLATLIGVATISNAAERVALVIGNGNYQNARKLSNPTRDAKAMVSVLRRGGFKVVVALDVGVEATFRALEDFKTAAKDARVGLFYFAGHGIEVSGKNFLLPVDAELKSSAQLRTQTVGLHTVLGDMKEVRLPAKMVILDCCRDNPLTRSWMTTRGSSDQGLGPIKDDFLPEATMIMYAAAPGKAAMDGTGKNSPFTKALVEQFSKPGVSAFDAFLGVSDSVAKTTGDRQIPWIKFDGAGRTFRLFSLIHAKAVAPSAEAPATDPPQGGAALPSTGFLNLAEIYPESPYAAYNNHSRKWILMRAQKRLGEEGLYKGEVDGVPGPGTHRALIRWQTDCGVPVTGKLDQSTLQTLGLSGIAELTAPGPSPPRPPKPPRTSDEKPSTEDLEARFRRLAEEFEKKD